VLASKLLIISGQTVSSEILATVARELKRLAIEYLYFEGQPTEEHEDGLCAMHMIGYTRKELRIKGQLDFPNLLKVSSVKTCLDPRDRVYAMLGMTWKGFRDRIQVSYYENSPKALFRVISIAQRHVSRSLSQKSLSWSLIDIKSRAFHPVAQIWISVEDQARIA